MIAIKRYSDHNANNITAMAPGRVRQRTAGNHYLESLGGGLKGLGLRGLGCLWRSNRQTLHLGLSLSLSLSLPMPCGEKSPKR